MAEFLLVFPLIMEWESLTWTRVIGDKGGETYAGISRVSWGHLEIWKRIDFAKAQIPGFDPDNEKTWMPLSNWLIKDDVTQIMVKKFYHDWWNRMRLSDVKSQKLANFIFQFAVNAGEGKVSRLVQMICVTNNRPIAIDGIIGFETMTAINTVPESDFIADLATMQEHHYIICRFSDRSQNMFKLGWKARVKAFL